MQPQKRSEEIFFELMGEGLPFLYSERMALVVRLMAVRAAVVERTGRKGAMG